MPAAVEPRRARPGTDPRRKGAQVTASPRRKGAPPAPARKPASKPAPKAAPKKAAPKKPTRTAATRDARRRAAHAPVVRTAARRLPTWADLDGGAAGPAPRRRPGVLDTVPSLKLAAWMLVACALATLYVGHVYATRATLAELQQARRDNLRLHLTHERLRGAFDRMTGPALVLERAAALGLEEGVAYAPPIRLED